MTTKQVRTKKKTTTPVKRNPDTLYLTRNEHESESRMHAENSLSTTTLNAVTARSFSKIMGVTDLTETISVMQEKVGNINEGDLTELEATLTAQSVTLDTMFNELARRAINSDTMSKLEIYMRLSLKAQSQCARTIEVLATMKNPPIVYAKQANIAHGNQQVNNGSKETSTRAGALAHAEKIINQPNELLEADYGSKKMDGRTAQTTIRKVKAMAALET